jgi:hypothetical protein
MPNMLEIIKRHIRRDLTVMACTVIHSSHIDTFQLCYIHIIILILGVCILLRVWDPGDGGGGLFRLRNVTLVDFYYLLLLKLLHVSVVRPSSRKNIFARILHDWQRIMSPPRLWPPTDCSIQTRPLVREGAPKRREKQFSGKRREKSKT